MVLEYDEADPSQPQYEYEKKPTPEVAEEKYTYLKGIWSGAWERWRKRDSYYHRTFNPWGDMPGGGEAENRPIYRPSTPASIIDHAADTQMGYEVRVHREPPGDDDEDQATSDKVEDALKAVMDEAGLLEPYLPWKTAGKYEVHYGYAVINGPIFRATGEPQKPRKIKNEEENEYRMARYKAAKRNWFPLRIQVPHPTSILLDPMEKQPTCGIKTVSLIAEKVAELSIMKHDAVAGAEKLDVTGYKRNQVLQLLDYWTDDWHMVKIQGGQHLWTERNRWGYVPFTHAFAGYGMQPFGRDGLDPKYLAKGLLEDIMESLKIQAQGRAGRHNLVMRHAFAPEGTTKDPAAAAQAIAQADMLQGKREDYWTMETQQVAQWMFTQDSEVAQDIEAGSYSRILMGLREPGLNTVGQTAMVSTAARQKFATTAIQMQHMASIVASRILQLVDTKKLTLRAGGLVLRYQDIKGDYNAKVTFEVVDPILDLERRKIGLQEVGARIITRQTYREEHRRVENEQKELDRFYDQDLMDMPEVRMKALERIAQAKQLGDVFEEGKESAQARFEQQAAPEVGGLQTNTPLNGNTTTPETFDLGALGGQTN